MKTAKSLIDGFEWQRPEVLTSFVKGEGAKGLYDSVKDRNFGWCEYDAEAKEIKGSNPFISAKIDTLVRPLGLRVANLRDLSRPEVMEMVRGKYYTDSPTLVVRSENDSYERNLSLIARILPYVEEANGKVEFPFMISGFDVEQLVEDKKGYGVDILRRDDFKAVIDDRLLGKWNEYKFNNVDEVGLPVDFDKKNGIRTWYVRDNGLSWFCLYWDLGLNSSGADLQDSYAGGRVVLVSAEGASQNFNEYIARLTAEKERQMKKVDDKFIKAMNILKA
jgi:hypothetical protein